MKSVLIAGKNEAEVEKIREEISKEFNAHTIRSPEELAGLAEKPDLILLDHTFTEHSGIDFLKQILEKHNLPVLMLAPPDDDTCVLETLKLGDYSYLVKTANYYHLLNLSVKRALERIQKLKDMKHAIVALRTQVTELEKRLGISQKNVVQAPPQKKPKSIYEEIASRLKNGEIGLPSIPQISVKFREMVKKGASVQELTNLLKHDAAISASLIRISNSPYYRGVSKNSTLEQAITRLGTNEAKMQVDLIANKSLYTNMGQEHEQVAKSLWNHSLACAYACKLVTEIAGSKDSEEAFTMGLLHDIGKLGLLKIICELEASGKMARKAERTDLQNMLDANHCEFGTTLLKSWQFPEEYLPITMYHSKLEAVDPVPKSLMVVHFANVLAKSMGYGQALPEDTKLENTRSWQFLKLDSEKIPILRDQVEKLMGDWGKVLDGSVG